MPDTSLFAERPVETLKATGAAPTGFEQLRELLRHGYRPDSGHEAGRAILLRRDQAPDLLLHPDGRIDVVARPAAKLDPAGAQRSPRRMSKRRTLAIVVLAAILWFFSVYFTAVILEGL